MLNLVRDNTQTVTTYYTNPYTSQDDLLEYLIQTRSPFANLNLASHSTSFYLFDSLCDRICSSVLHKNGAEILSKLIPSGLAYELRDFSGKVADRLDIRSVPRRWGRR